MDHPQADLLPLKLESLNVGRHQVGEEQTADQIAAREHRYFPTGALRPPINQEAAKELVLGFVQPQIHLRQRADKNQHQPQAQTGHGEAQRTEKLDQPVKEHGDI